MSPLVILLFITAHSLESATVTKNAKTMDVITFPNEGGHVIKTREGPKQEILQVNQLSNKFGDDGVHESCKDLTYCTIKPLDYPEKKFNEMFKNYKIPPLPTFDALGNRQGDISLTDDCEFETTYDPLYKARSKRDEPWRTVIQAPEQGFVQRVRSDICKSTGSSCFKPFLPVPLFETSCEQMYNTWEVLVETLDGKGKEQIKAIIPSCCSCKYKHVPAILSRLNPDDKSMSASKSTKA